MSLGQWRGSGSPLTAKVARAVFKATIRRTKTLSMWCQSLVTNEGLLLPYDSLKITSTVRLKWSKPCWSHRGRRSTQGSVPLTQAEVCCVQHGCVAHPKQTVQLIAAQGNDYLVGVKGNQPNLLKHFVQVAQQQCPCSVDIQTEHTRDRVG